MSSNRARSDTDFAPADVGHSLSLRPRGSLIVKFMNSVIAAFVAAVAVSAAGAPVVLDFEEVDNAVPPASSSYWLPFGSSYVGKEFVIEDLNSYGTPPQQGLLFTYFAQGTWVPIFNGPAPFKSADTDGKSLFPQYSTAAISLHAVDNSPFLFTSLKLAGFFDRSGEFSLCEMGPATCTVQLAFDVLGAPGVSYDLALDNLEGFEKWAFNLDNVVSVTLRQTTQNLAAGIGGWSYQFDDFVLNGEFDPLPYESLASVNTALPEPTTLFLLAIALVGFSFSRRRHATRIALRDV